MSFGYRILGFGVVSRNKIELTIPADTTNYDVFTEAVAAGYAGGNTDVIVTINNGIFVGSTSTGTFAMTVDNNFVDGDKINIINNGDVTGKGGAGGSPNSNPGGAGGDAINVTFAPPSGISVFITNNGTFAGGGGGGGAGGRGRAAINILHATCNNSPITANGGAGGGGAGFTETGNGSKTAGGGGSSGATVGGTCTKNGGNGGSGGNPGVNGSNGTAGSTVGSTCCLVSNTGGGAGGTTGNYAVGNSNITFLVDGIRLGGVS